MGCWSVYCGISQIAIRCGDKCAVLPLKLSRNSVYLPQYIPATVPIFGEYDDYGGLEKIEKNLNTDLIENHFGITIDEFVKIFTDWKTLERNEVEYIIDKCKNYDELMDWKFMFINKDVYEFMSTHVKGGYETEEFVNWKTYPKTKQVELLCWIIDNIYYYRSYEYEEQQNLLSELMDKLKDKLSNFEITAIQNTKKEHKTISSKYLHNLDYFGDELVKLIYIKFNLGAMSRIFEPYLMYVTPQDGELEEHQIILEKFAEINKSLMR